MAHRHPVPPTRPATADPLRRCGFALALLSLLAPAPSFGAPQLPALGLFYPAGTQPHGLAAGDLNGDGLPDLVVANAGSGTVSVMPGTGLGFGARTDYPTSGDPQKVALADFDRDGRLDMAVAAGSANAVAVRMGNGAGGFGPARYFAVPSLARGIAAGDLDRDGRVDLVVANLYGNSVSVFLGDGMGGFAPRVDRYAGNGPASVAIGDFDQDDIPDLAVADYFGNQVTLLSGTGTGTAFLEYATINVPANPVAILLTDANGNGTLDVVTANLGNNSVSIIPINPPGVGAAITHPVGLQPSDVAVALDRYGRTTLAVSNWAASSVTMLTLDAGGGLVSSTEWLTGWDPSAVLLMDPDGDGQLDIVAANYGQVQVHLIKTTGDALFPVAETVSDFGGGKALGDVDRDGDLDLAGGGSSGLAWVRLGNGDGSFGPLHLISVPSSARQIALEDITGDGNLDLVTVTTGPQLVGFARNLGTGSFIWAGSQSAAWPVALATADLDRDGWSDVVAVSQTTGQTGVFFNNGTGGLSPPVNYAVGSGPFAVALGKLNNNEIPDIVVANEGSNSVSVLLSDPITSAQWIPSTNYPVGTGPRGVALGDLNGDGTLDIVTSNTYGDNFSILLGTGNGVFAPATSHPASGTPTAIKLADVNADGRLDIVAGLSAGIGVYLGNGLGGFGPLTLHSASPSGTNAVVGDISGDGRLDVIGDSYASGSRIFLGPTPTRTTLAAPPLAIEGSPVTLTAIVMWTGPVAPTGTVRFFDGTTPLGSASLTGGIAALSTFASLTGERKLTAIFEGDSRFFGSFSNVVPQRVVSTPKPAIASITDVKGDQGGRVRLRFDASPFDYFGSATPITGYSIYRQVVPGLAPSAAARSAASFPELGSVDPDAIAIAGWDFVVTMPASAEIAYETVVPTLADSNGTGTNRATFFVRAATATPGVFYDSAPDSGHSVDNLPPAVPMPFVAAYASGATHLHWGANTESDLWHYSLHRGTSEGFVPGPGNLIASPADTGYADPGPAGFHYKLAAVDVNGNVSAYALVTPSGTTDVGERSLLALALEGARPNPARSGRASVAFSLPSGAPARLECIDVGGRCVVSREVGGLGPGPHVVDLAEGRRLPPGVYLLRLTQNGASRTARTTVLD